MHEPQTGSVLSEESPRQSLNQPLNDKPTCNTALCVVGYDPEGDWYHAIETRCNRWSCPECGPLKTWQLCKRIEAAKPNRFVTLTTARPDGQTPREVWDHSRRQVSELAKKLRKSHGSFEYCRVLEEHKSGFPHFHLVVRSPFIAQEELSRNWCSLTDAFIVDIRKIDPNRKVARYIAKHLAKQTQNSITNRRVTATKGFWNNDEEDVYQPLGLIDIQRHHGTLEDLNYYEYPNTVFEYLTPRHAIMKGHRPDDAPF